MKNKGIPEYRQNFNICSCPFIISKFGAPKKLQKECKITIE